MACGRYDPHAIVVFFAGNVCSGDSRGLRRDVYFFVNFILCIMAIDVILHQ